MSMCNEKYKGEEKKERLLNSSSKEHFRTKNMIETYALVQFFFYLLVGEVKWNYYMDALEEECTRENMKEGEGEKL